MIWLSDSGNNALNIQNVYFGDIRAYWIKWGDYFYCNLEILKMFIDSYYWQMEWMNETQKQQLQLQKIQFSKMA